MLMSKWLNSMAAAMNVVLEVSTILGNWTTRLKLKTKRSERIGVGSRTKYQRKSYLDNNLKDNDQDVRQIVCTPPPPGS